MGSDVVGGAWWGVIWCKEFGGTLCISIHSVLLVHNVY